MTVSMTLLSLAFFTFSLWARLSLSLSPDYLDCQLQKPPGESPLAGCPGGTLYVSHTDLSANFSDVQGAIDSLSETGHAIVLIGKGQYFEMINVTRSAPLTLLGQLDPNTAFLPSGNASQRNLVHIWNNLYVKTGMTDEETATLSVGPPPGQSFGNVDFKAYNIDFENHAASYAISQALVTSITYANASFYGCAFASWQDTWYTGHGANTYVVDSIIYGQTDYLFGFGIAHVTHIVCNWFQNVTLANRACGPGITAWQGVPGTRNGAYIADSRIIRSPDANATTMTSAQCYLGRPWNVYAVSVFLRNYMGDIINPAGFNPWRTRGETTVPNTTFYAEFDSYGPGSDTSARVPQDHLLNHRQARQFRLEDVFGGRPRWIDVHYQY